MKSHIRIILSYGCLVLAFILGTPDFSKTLSLIGGSYWGEAGRLEFRMNIRWILIEFSLIDLLDICIGSRASSFTLIRYRSIAKAFIQQLKTTFRRLGVWIVILLILAFPQSYDDCVGMLVYLTHVLHMMSWVFLLYTFINSESVVWLIQTLVCTAAMMIGWIAPYTPLSCFLSWGMVFRSSVIDNQMGYPSIIAVVGQCCLLVTFMIISKRFYWMRVDRGE